MPVPQVLDETVEEVGPTRARATTERHATCEGASSSRFEERSLRW